MENNYKAGIVAGVVSVAIGLFFALTGGGHAGPQGPVGPQGQTAAPSYGALSGPDIASPYLGWGGVRTFRASQSLVQSTTTICALQSPASTSTLSHYGVRFDVGSSSAMTVYIAKATTAFATTTQLGQSWTLAASSKGFINGSTTATQVVAANEVFAPNSWLNFTVQGGDSGANATGLVPTGLCEASWTAF